MNMIILSVATGVGLGFLASVMKSTDSREDLVRNLFLGMGGAYVGTWLAPMLFESADGGSLSFALVTTSIVVSVAVLFVFNKARKA